MDAAQTIREPPIVTMPRFSKIKVFVSYSHKDENYHRRLKEHLRMLRKEGTIDVWDDLMIRPGEKWDNKIIRKLKTANIILLLISQNFLDSKYVRKTEIPLALTQAEKRRATIVPVVLEECDWKETPLAKWQALPPTSTPVSSWPSHDVAYAEIAKGIAAVASTIREGVTKKVQFARDQRQLTIYRHTPFRILAENYDPFRAFEQVFRLTETRQIVNVPPLPLHVPLEDRIEFHREDYQSILGRLRRGQRHIELAYDLVAIPYWLLGHCVAHGLISPLDDTFETYQYDYAWWDEMGAYKNQLYGVPLSALSMILAVREDLFEHYQLPLPNTWQDYLSVIDAVISRRLPVAPDLLQGRCHITLWYDWLNHLYANHENDLALYGRNRLPAHQAAATLRKGTVSFLSLASKLAPYKKGSEMLPHWATANWDDGIEQFAQGNLLMHMMFNDALDTLRRRMEVPKEGTTSNTRVRFLPIPTAMQSDQRHGHIEGWILCVPRSSRYQRIAKELLKWFLEPKVQREYSRWSGASAHLQFIQTAKKDAKDRGAAAAYRESVEHSRLGRARVDLVKHKGPETLAAIDRIIVNLYDAVIAVARDRISVEDATDALIKKVERRLLMGLG